MLLKLKSAFIAICVFMVVGTVFRDSALADPVCGTLEECRSLRVYLQEHIVKQECRAVRAFLQSQLTQVEARIEELLQGEPETRATTTGDIFKRDRSHPSSLGEAWKDPNNLIWGDIVKRSDGRVYEVKHSTATDYCTSMGLRLPTREEFIQLREYMGARFEYFGDYRPQVLPNLSGHWFWSSSVNPNGSEAYVLWGTSGGVYYESRNYKSAFRCVAGH